jgi:hypothetical protein
MITIQDFPGALETFEDTKEAMSAYNFKKEDMVKGLHCWTVATTIEIHGEPQEAKLQIWKFDDKGLYTLD